MVVPKLRFKGFNDEWKTYNLKQVVEIRNGLNKEKESFGIGTPIINYMDVNKNEILTSDKIKGLVKLSEKEIDNFRVKKGDIFFTRTSETSDEIGLSSSLIEDINDCVFSGFVLKATPITNILNPLFSGYYFRTYKLRKEIIKHSSITTRALTSGSLLYGMNINIPNVNEQEKIGKLLQLLDKKMELQKRKIETLKIYKIGLIQKLFRFNTFYEKKLEDICNITTGKLDANAMTPNGKYRFYTCAKEYYYINTYAFDTEALLISGNGAYVGYIHYYKGKFNAYQRTYVLNNFSENILYTKYYLDTFLSKRILAERKEGNTPYIVLNTLAKMPIIFPSFKVQNQIVTTLIKFDTKLDLENKKLDKLNIMKKSLFQQMFI